jgi:hypothetical protein
MHFEEALFRYVKFIKMFNSSMQEEFSVKEVSYNSAGIDFPKEGIVNIDFAKVKYKFHGSGCNLFWDNFTIQYDLNTSDTNMILVSPWKFNQFLKTYLPFTKEQLKDEDVYKKLTELENEGVLTKRQPNDLMTFHVSEAWYKTRPPDGASL